MAFITEEYDPESMYIRGVDNILADAIIRLDYNPNLNCHADNDDSDEYISEQKRINFLALFNHYNLQSSDRSNEN